jgi:hypothetical protein
MSAWHSRYWPWDGQIRTIMKCDFYPQYCIF